MSGEAHGATLRFLRNGAGDLPPTDRLILLLLANREDHDRGYAWPSVGNLALEAGIKRRAAQYALGRLEKRGLVAREYRRAPAGDPDTTAYRLTFPAAGVAQPIAGGRRNPLHDPLQPIAGGVAQPIAPKEEGGKRINKEAQKGTGAAGAPPATTTAPQVRLAKLFHAGKTPRAEVVARARGLLDAWADAGLESVLWQLATDGAGRGWRWSGFVSAAEQRLDRVRQLRADVIAGAAAPAYGRPGETAAAANARRLAAMLADADQEGDHDDNA